MPILDELKQWLDDKNNLLPKSPLGIVVSYLRNQWPKLLTYLDDGRISIDNNIT